MSLDQKEYQTPMLKQIFSFSPPLVQERLPDPVPSQQKASRAEFPLSFPSASLDLTACFRLPKLSAMAPASCPCVCFISGLCGCMSNLVILLQFLISPSAWKKGCGSLTLNSSQTQLVQSRYWSGYDWRSLSHSWTDLSGSF